MWGCKIDIRVCSSTSLSVRIDGCGQFSKVGRCPGIDGDDEQEQSNAKEDDATTDVSAFPFFI